MIIVWTKNFFKCQNAVDNNEITRLRFAHSSSKKNILLRRPLERETISAFENGIRITGKSNGFSFYLRMC